MRAVVKEGREAKILITRQQHAEAEFAKAKSEAGKIGQRDEIKRCTDLQSLRVKTTAKKDTQAIKTNMSEAELLEARMALDDMNDGRTRIHEWKCEAMWQQYQDGANQAATQLQIEHATADADGIIAARRCAEAAAAEEERVKRSMSATQS